MSPVAPLVAHSWWRWLVEGEADKGVAPYAWSQFNHEHFKSVFRRSPRKGVMIDDEHIVVVEVRDVNELSGRVSFILMQLTFLGRPVFAGGG
ncbi:hypothetical protein FRC12_012472 [Ceratobasidium sp. 428]|nr:hypothetical protein FRC12_012472 [Ceratobasidium sp. 428]